MAHWERFAVYVTPPPGPLAEFTARWLGWDPVAGAVRSHPNLQGLPRPVSALTAAPRRYGFHGTLRAPFRTGDGVDATGVAEAVGALAARLAPVTLPGVQIEALGRFLALRPEGETAPLDELAAAVVEGTDTLRAPLGWAELAKRRAAGLSQRQDALLQRWGYPYTHEEFRFHMTLTGRLAAAELETVRAALAPHLEPLLPRPMPITDLTLLGSDADGRFHQIARFPLGG